MSNRNQPKHVRDSASIPTMQRIPSQSHLETKSANPPAMQKVPTPPKNEGPPKGNR